MTDPRVDVQELGSLSARCAGCGTLSEPRPLGHTPTGWERGVDGQGGYWCPVCVKKGRS